MSCDFSLLARPGVQGLQPYQPGKPIDELKREMGLERVIKLASNENPLGLSPLVKDFLSSRMDELTRYPDGAGFELKDALSAKFDVDPACITLGNGSNDVLDLIGLCFLDESVSAVYSEHAFVVYPMMVKYLGAKAIETPAVDYGHDLHAMLQAIHKDTRVIFIANPNNPTGTWLGHQALYDFVSKVPEDIIVVIDEAYSEYIHDVDYADGLKIQKAFDNVIVTRTFSKAYGLAGLRVGFSISSPQLADLLNRVREPFNVNTLAQLAAVEVLKDDEYLKESIKVNDEGRKQLEEGISALDLDVIPAQGNFVTFDTGQDAADVYHKLLQQGVIVRPIGAYGMPRHLRVSIGLHEENAMFLKALVQVL